MDQFKYFYNFYIDGENLTTLLVGKKSFSFGSTITSLYPTGVLEIYLSSTLIESGLVSIGSPVKFEIFKEDKTVIVKEFKIWKIVCMAQENTRSLSGIYQLTFIHPWYFNQEVKSKAYAGSSQIVMYNAIIEEQFNTFKGVYIDKSKDVTAKHYRTYQTIGTFLEERLYDKYVVDNSPTFMFVNDNNEFHAHSFISMLKTEKENRLIDLRTIKEDSVRINKSKELDRLINPLSVKYELNKSGTLSNRINTKTSLLYFNHTSRSLDSLSDGNSLFGSKGFYPIHASSITTYPQSVYLSNTEQEADHIYAGFLQKQKDLLFDQSMSFICSPNFTIQIGEPIDVYLKKTEDYNSIEADINSIFYASYLITGIRHIQMNDDFVTQLTVCRDIIDSKAKDSLQQNKVALDIK